MYVQIKYAVGYTVCGISQMLASSVSTMHIVVQCTYYAHCGSMYMYMYTYVSSLLNVCCHKPHQTKKEYEMLCYNV